MADIVLLDGGMGQELLHRSKQPPHALWSAKVMMDEPEIVQAVHLDYIRAGAKVITLNTYSATPERLEFQGIPEMFEPLQAKAVEIAGKARDESGAADVRIAGCLPPLRTSYRPDLALPFDQGVAAYRRIAACQAGHVDVILCETMSAIVEARAAATAAAETGKPVWLSLSVADEGGKVLRSGEMVDAALEALSDIPVQAILLNCSRPEAISEALPLLIASGRPAGAYANAFAKAGGLSPGSTVEALEGRKDMTPENYAEIVAGWVGEGARIVGGCCEIGPVHIAAVRDRLVADGYTIKGELA
ncbi:MAG: homocysteine S-methyltransferase family protein [Paracoccaceae bacterium]